MGRPSEAQDVDVLTREVAALGVEELAMFLAELSGAMARQTKAVEDLDRDRKRAVNNHTDALNRLNNMQHRLESVIDLMRSKSASGSDWHSQAHRNRGLAIKPTDHLIDLSVDPADDKKDVATQLARSGLGRD